MPDTQANAEAFGKPANQRGQAGFPVMRFVVLLCLATGVVLESALDSIAAKIPAN